MVLPASDRVGERGPRAWAAVVVGDMAVPALTPVAAAEPVVLRTVLASLGELVASGENGAEPAAWIPPEKKKDKRIHQHFNLKLFAQGCI